MKRIILPDWRNPETYSHLAKISLNQWAWEFLRRNPEYIEDWEDFQSKWPVESRDDYSGKLPKGFPSIKLSLKWGIDNFRNPNETYKDRKDDPDGICFDPPGGFETQTMGKTKASKKNLFFGLPDFKTGEQNFQFNFLLPINPQIKIAKEMLLRLQEKAKGKKAFKPRSDEWILLIRILDATAAGAKDKEIASVLFPDERSGDTTAGIKKVYDKRKQAMHYVNHDYRLIPYSDK